MKRNFISTLGVSLLALLASCSHEVQTGGYPVGGSGKMTVQVEGYAGQSGQTTRATQDIPSVEGENTINSLYLLFFNAETGAYDSYAQVEGIPTTPTAGGDGSVPMNVDGFAYPAGKEAAAWNILALANIATDNFIDVADTDNDGDKIDDWMAQWTGRNEAYVMANAMAQLPASIGSGRLLMHGRIEKPEGEGQIHLTLTRDVARIDVSNRTSTTQRLVSATIWNAFPSTSIWEQNGVDANTARLERHYGVTLTGGEGNNWPTSIDGGLYAFENRVAALTPETYHDRLTTCLIVGLQPTSPANAPVEYYRANITNDNGAQNIVRNHAYRLNITGVIPNTGAKSEQEAYLGESNGIIYYIGDWDEDTNGLSVSDDFSTLAIPTKMVVLGSGKDLPADEKVTAEFRIHTFSTLDDPAPLRIRTQTFTPATNVAGEPSIEARLDGSTLIVEATHIDADNTPRKGVIVLSYAGLEIAMNVSQSGTNDYFLNVTLPDGGILPFAAYAGIPSGLINVQASGHWTARLHMTGFSFGNQQDLPTKLIWTNPANPGDPEYIYTDGRGYNTSLDLIVPDDVDPTVDKFRVWTNSHNMGAAAREAFVVIELDGKDRDGNDLSQTYSSMVLLQQTYVKALQYVRSDLDPGTQTNWQSEGGVTTFNGVGGLAQGAGFERNSDYWFVIPGRQETTPNNILSWQTLLVQNGATDDRDKFEIVRDENVENHTQMSATDPRGNIVKVRAKGLNTAGREFRATLRVQTDPGTFADITVIQQPADWNVPKVTVSIGAKGGETAALTLDAFPGMHYIAEIESVSGTDHFAYVAETAGGIPYSKLKPRESTQSFVVGFPKMIYPNLYNPISATVKVTMVESGESKTFTVLQSPPAQKTVNIFNVGLDWGGISNIARQPYYSYTLSEGAGEADGDTGGWYGWYCGAWARGFHRPDYFGNSGSATVKINTSAPGLASAEYGYFVDVSSQVMDNATFIHFTRPAEYSGGADWQAANNSIWNWITDPDNEGVLLVNAEADATESANQFSSGYVPGKMGLSGGSSNETYGVAQGESRVMDYLTESGPFGRNSRTSWSTEGVTSYINTSSVENIDQAVPVLVNGSGHCAIMVDPKRRIVAKVDSEMVRNNAEMQGLVLNLQAWLMNTAQYGTHFSEYFWDSPRYTMPEPGPQE